MLTGNYVIHVPMYVSQAIFEILLPVTQQNVTKDLLAVVLFSGMFTKLFYYHPQIIWTCSSCEQLLNFPCLLHFETVQSTDPQTLKHQLFCNINRHQCKSAGIFPDRSDSEKRLKLLSVVCNYSYNIFILVALYSVGQITVCMSVNMLGGNWGSYCKKNRKCCVFDSSIRKCVSFFLSCSYLFVRNMRPACSLVMLTPSI